MIRPILAIVLLTLVPFRGAGAQETNAERMSAIAVACVAEHTSGADTLSIAGPERLPFIRSAVTAAWQASGIPVFDADRARAGTEVRLAVTDAGVVYRRAEGGQFERTVRLDLGVRVTAPDGRVLADETCSRSETDLPDAADVQSLEDPTWPETVGEAPRPGFLRRIAQPLIVAAATAAGVFLFFSLRSRRADDGG